MKTLQCLYSNTAVTLSFATRTNGIHGDGDSRALAGFASSSGVDSSDPVFILQALYQARGAIPCHGDGILVDLHPPVSMGLFTFNDVASNGGATVVLRWMPGQGHALVGDIKHLWSAWRSRNGCTETDSLNDSKKVLFLKLMRFTKPLNG